MKKALFLTLTLISFVTYFVFGQGTSGTGGGGTATIISSGSGGGDVYLSATNRFVGVSNIFLGTTFGTTNVLSRILHIGATNAVYPSSWIASIYDGITPYLVIDNDFGYSSSRYIAFDSNYGGQDVGIFFDGDTSNTRFSRIRQTGNEMFTLDFATNYNFRIYHYPNQSVMSYDQQVFTFGQNASDAYTVNGSTLTLPSPLSVNSGQLIFNPSSTGIITNGVGGIRSLGPVYGAGMIASGYRAVENMQRVGTTCTNDPTTQSICLWTNILGYTSCTNYIPALGSTNFIFTIKDASGLAAYTNIVILPLGGATIDGQTSRSINIGYGAAELLWVPTQNMWMTK